MNSIETTTHNICLTKSFWCHICKQEFTRIVMQSVNTKCVNCNSPFCEEINAQSINDHPSTFRPFNINQCKIIKLTKIIIISFKQ